MYLDKEDKKRLDAIRHQVHMTGELLTLRQMLDRMEVYGDRPCIVEKEKGVVVTHTVKDFRAV